MSRADGIADPSIRRRADDGVVVIPEASETAPRRRHRWRLLAIPATAAILVAVAVLFTHSGFFSAKHVRVTGATHLSAQQVIRESGVTGDTNVFYLDAGDVEARLGRDPWIADVTVTKSLPGTVTVNVVERIAVAEIDRNGLHVLVSGEGTILGTQTRDPRLPVLLSSAAGTSAPPVTTAAPALAAMSADQRLDVVSASVDDGGEVTLLLRHDVVVRYGAVSDVVAKAVSLDVVLSWGESHHKRFDSIDVTSPDAPAAVLVGGLSVQP